MKKLKHSKFKNPAVLFELLVRQVASDTLNNKDSQALNIIKEYFGKNTELNKELGLYQTLLKEKFKSETHANSFINAVLTAHKKLNNSTINKQKYSLIREIKKTYVIEDFFQTRVNDYKLLASIYKIFEHSENENPADFINSKNSLCEHIITVPKETKVLVENKDDFKNQHKDIRLLSYKILIDKFNERYQGLDIKQKTLLKSYINNVSNSNYLKEYIIPEITEIKKDIKSLSKNITSKVVTIKLNEVSNLLDRISNAPVIKDSYILAMLRYYELLKELKKSEVK